MRERNDRMPSGLKRWLFRLTALMLVLCLLPVSSLAEDTKEESDEWVHFLLICNEGMNNDKGNAGNTLMYVAMDPEVGRIRLMMFTWDTFVDYEGYDVPQKLDMPYRNNGPEECVKIFNANFGTNIEYFLSLNYLNLASMIDTYGGVDVDISRAERNALNGMVESKKNALQSQVATGFLSQAIVEMLAEEYYLTEFGPNTHLNGLQAVGFGWLQYDSVYNCCLRDAKVISNFFDSVAVSISDQVQFYTDETGVPDFLDGRRLINLDHVTDDDYWILRREIDPIFRMSYHNMPEEKIYSVTMALARIAYQASRQGVDLFDHLQFKIFPLEATEPYDLVAGTKGHLVNKEANAAAMEEFLYQD